MTSTPRSPKASSLPQYRPSLVSAPAYDYRVYHLSVWETLLYGVAAFAVAGLVGLLFFGGLGRDAEGAATNLTRVLDTIVFVVPGLFAAHTFLKQLVQRESNKADTRLMLPMMLMFVGVLVIFVVPMFSRLGG